MALQQLNSFQRKNRQKARNRMIANVLILSSLSGVFYFAYQFGERQMAARVNQRMDEVEHLTQERDALHQQVVDLQAAALVDQQKIKQLEARYREQIPNDTVEGMIRTIQEKLAKGVSVERLQTILQSAANPRNCRGRDVKRFILSTSLHQGTDSTVTFNNGAVTVTGEGATFTNSEGRPEAWYDPTKKVSMKFRLIGGKVSVAEGVLPLQHSIIDDAVEYRFSIEGGPRGFVTVTGDQCDYSFAPPAPPVIPGEAGTAPTAAPAAGTAPVTIPAGD